MSSDLPITKCSCRVQVVVAFDLGDIVDIDKASKLMGIERPVPFGLPLLKPSLTLANDAQLTFGNDGLTATRRVSIFHFGTISICYEFVRGSMSEEELQKFSEFLVSIHPELRVDARREAESLYRKIKSAIIAPVLSPIDEDYVTFWCTFEDRQTDAINWCREHRTVIGSLLRMSEDEGRVPSEQRVDEVLDEVFSWNQGDAQLLAWNGALLINVADSRALSLIEYVNSFLLGTRVMLRVAAGEMERAYMRRRMALPLTQQFRMFIPRESSIRDASADTAYLSVDLKQALDELRDPYLRKLFDEITKHLKLPELQADVGELLGVLDGFAEAESSGAGERRNELWAVAGIILAYVALDKSGIMSAWQIVLAVGVLFIVIVAARWFLKWRSTGGRSDKTRD